MSTSKKYALLAIAVALGLAGLSASDARGLRHYRRLDAQIATLQDKQRALSEENEALRREIAALSGDTQALERAAREDLGLVRATELVFTFEH